MMTQHHSDEDESYLPTLWAVMFLGALAIITGGGLGLGLGVLAVTIAALKL